LNESFKARKFPLLGSCVARELTMCHSNPLPCQDVYCDKKNPPPCMNHWRVVAFLMQAAVQIGSKRIQ